MVKDVREEAGSEREKLHIIMSNTKLRTEPRERQVECNVSTNNPIAA